MNPAMNAPVILITGAAKRLGAQIARNLHVAGASVAIHFHHSQTDADALVAELCALRANSAQAFKANLLDIAALPDLVNQVVTHFGALDGLVNNASTFFATQIGEIDGDKWEDIVGTNLRAPLFLAQAVAAHLAKRGMGCIVNITDIHAERPLKNYPVYCAAKAGLLGLTRSLAVELAPKIRVNAVAPGAIMWPDASEDFSADEQAAIIRHTLLGRIGQAEDIARAVRFLMFDAPYITGQVINVDGGRTAHL